MIGEHAGYCIGGPWNAKQLADLRDRVVLYVATIDLPGMSAPVAIRGEYRWRDGSWEWVVG